MSQHFYPEILETGAILGLTLATGSITVNLNQEFLVQGLLIDTNDRGSGPGVNGRQVDITGFTSQSNVHLRYTMDGGENSSLGLEPDMFYAVLGSADTAGTSSTAYDLYIADFDVDASDNVTINEYIVNKSRLVIDTIDSQTHNAATTTPSTTTDPTITLNDGEVGAGVTGGFSGLIIDRGSSTNYQIFMSETGQSHLEAGLEGDLKKVAIFSAEPVVGGILTVGDIYGNLTQSDNLIWDSTNKRLVVDQAGGSSFTATEAIHTDGNYQGGQWVIMGHQTASIGFNVDKDDQYVVNGYASKLVSSGGTFAIYVSSSSGIAGNSVSSWDSLYAWNNLGNVGFNIAASTTASEILSVGGSVYMSGSAPVLNTNDTSSTSGFKIDLAGVTSDSDPIFTIYDNETTSNVLVVNYDRETSLTSGLFNLQGPVDADDTVLHLRSVDNEARIILNSSESQTYDSAYVASLYQQSEDHGTYPRDLFITTGSSAGNMILASKYNGSTATGYVGINQLIPICTLDITGTSRIYQASLPYLRMQDGSASWYMYLDSTNHGFKLGATTSSYALNVRTGTIDSGDDFVWNRSANRLGLGYTVASGGEAYKLHIKSAEAQQVYLKGTAGDTGILMNSFTNANAVIKMLQDGTGMFNFGMYEDTTNYFGIYGVTATSFGLKIYDGSNDVEFDGGGFKYDVSEDTLNLGDWASFSTSWAQVDSNLKINNDAGLTSGTGGIEYQVATTTNGAGFRTFAGIVPGSGSDVINYTVAYRHDSDTWSNAINCYYDEGMTNADERIFVHIGPEDGASDATAASALTIAGFENSAYNEAGGLEFKLATTSTGSGIRLIPTLGASQTSLIIAHRYQSATWVPTVSIAYETSTPRTIINITSLPNYNNDTDAGTGGLVTGDLYTSTSTDNYIKIKI